MKTKNRSLTPRVTFRQMVAELRPEAVDHLWLQAVQFSRLRHLAVESKKSRAARRCGECKARLIGKVCRLAPELVKVVPASDSERLFSVRYRHRGWLHLPPRYVEYC